MAEQPYEPPFETVDLKHSFGVLASVPPLWTPYEMAEIILPEFQPIEEPLQMIKLCGE